MRVLVTRPEPEASRFAAELQGLGIEALVAPLLAIEPTSDPIPDLSDVQAILATSANGLRAFAVRSERRDLPLLAVGDATALAAREAGFARVVSAEGDWRALAALVSERLDPQSGALLHVAGEERAGELGPTLSPAGFTLRRAVVYRAVAETNLPEAARAALEAGSLDGVAFFSPRTARIFLALVEQAGLAATTAGLTAFCMSPAVAEPLEAAAWRAIRVAARPAGEAMQEIIAGRSWIRATSKGERAMDGTQSEAERIVAAFGGIRPMAKAMNLPVTTVQGWKERGTIPLARMAQVREAAGRAGIDLAALTPTRPAEPRPEPAARVHAARVEEPPPSGLRAADAAPPPPPIVDVAPPPAQGAARRALWFGVGCGAAFLLGGLVAWYFGLGTGQSDASRRAIEGVHQRIAAMTGQIEEQSRRLQGETTSAQARNARIEQLERAIGEQRDRLASAAANIAAIASRIERLDTDLKAVAGRAPDQAQAIAALRDRLEPLLQRVDALTRRAAEEGELAKLPAALRQLGGRLDELEARLARLAEARPPADLDEARATLDRHAREARETIEKQLAAARTEIEKIGAEGRGRSERLAAESQSLRQEVEALEGRTRALAADLARAGAGEAGALLVALGQLRHAVESGGAYRSALDSVSALAKDRAGFAEPLAALGAAAARGLASTARLRAEYEPVAAAILRAGTTSEAGDDWWGRISARLRSLVTVRRTGEVTGESPEARVSRAEAALARGDLGKALAEIEALPSALRAPAEPWLGALRARLSADAQLATLDRLSLALIRGEK